MLYPLWTLRGIEIPAHWLQSTYTPWKHNMGFFPSSTIGRRLPDSSMKDKLHECLNDLICLGRMYGLISYKVSRCKIPANQNLSYPSVLMEIYFKNPPKMKYIFIISTKNILACLVNISVNIQSNNHLIRLFYSRLLNSLPLKTLWQRFKKDVLSGSLWFLLLLLRNILWICLTLSSLGWICRWGSIAFLSHIIWSVICNIMIKIHCNWKELKCVARKVDFILFWNMVQI